MSEFAGKVALVTGAASGIGAATADLLHARGARVWRADLAGTELALDVTDPGGWAVALETIAAAAPLDILVNAAGISRSGEGDHGVASADMVSWRRIFAVNVEGTMLGCQAAMRTMRAGGGAIVNVASTTAEAPTPTLAAYGASKAAVLQLTRSVAAACAIEGLAIRCNAVLPGMAETPMTAGLSDDMRARWIRQIPANRFADPAEVAEAIAFLASDRSSYVNGAGLPVDGGLLSRPVVR